MPFLGIKSVIGNNRLPRIWVGNKITDTEKMPAENYLEIGNRLPYRKILFRVSLVIFLVRMVCLKQDAPLLQSCNTSQTQLAFDVKGSERWTSGDRPVDLCQVGSYGSCLSALRSRLICSMEGVFTSKGAVEMGAVKSFQGGNHINKKVPITVAN